MVTAVTVVAGVITGYTITPGIGYTAPQLAFQDTTGSGAVGSLLIDNTCMFTADAPVFNPATDVGSVIRMGGGMATITAVATPQSVAATATLPITSTMPNDPNAMPVPAPPGTWTLTAPITSVTNLNHLEGMWVTGLADGNVIPLQVVTGGAVVLQAPASAVVVGLPFVAQGQTMHADMPGQMIQGKRKRVQGVTMRFANTRGVKLGQDQPIAAATPNQAETPWNIAPNFMTEIDVPGNAANASAAIPLFTGDYYASIAGDFSTTQGQPSPGMVAWQQDYPLPVEVLAAIPEMDIGDLPNA